MQTLQYQCLSCHKVNVNKLDPLNKLDVKNIICVYCIKCKLIKQHVITQILSIHKLNGGFSNI